MRAGRHVPLVVAGKVLVVAQVVCSVGVTGVLAWIVFRVRT